MIGLIAMALSLAVSLPIAGTQPSLGWWGWIAAWGALVTLSLLAFYQAYVCRSMTYAVFEGKLLIRRGPETRVIPVGEISKTTLVKDLDAPRPNQRWWWPGHHRFAERIAGVGRTDFYTTTRNPDEILLVMTSVDAVAISPEDVDAVRQAIQKEQAAGMDAKAETRFWPLAGMAFWRDHSLQILMIVCLGLAAILLAVLLGRIPALPELIPLRFNTFDQPLSISPRSAILEIGFGALGAAIASVVAGVFVHGRDRVAAYISVAGGIGVQILFFIAAIRIAFRIFA